MFDASKLCAGTLFVLLLKFATVLSIICGYEWLFDGGFLVGGIDCSALLLCWGGVLGGSYFCHSVLDHGLNLHWNIPLSECVTLSCCLPLPLVRQA